MILLAEALQPFVLKGLMSLRGRQSDMTVADLIIRPKKAGYDLDYSDTDQSISVEF